MNSSRKSSLDFYRSPSLHAHVQTIGGPAQKIEGTLAFVGIHFDCITRVLDEQLSPTRKASNIVYMIRIRSYTRSTAGHGCFQANACARPNTMDGAI